MQRLLAGAGEQGLANTINFAWVRAWQPILDAFSPAVSGKMHKRCWSRARFVSEVAASTDAWAHCRGLAGEWCSSSLGWQAQSVVPRWRRS